MKKTKLEKGITLIALIITIIILLILAVVTIGSIKDSKIFSYAQNAADDYNREKSEEQDVLDSYEKLIEDNINSEFKKFVISTVNSMEKSVEGKYYNLNILRSKVKDKYPTAFAEVNGGGVGLGSVGENYSSEEDFATILKVLNDDVINILLNYEDDLFYVDMNGEIFDYQGSAIPMKESEAEKLFEYRAPTSSEIEDPEENGVIITAYLGIDTTVRIPAVLYGEDGNVTKIVQGIGENVFKKNDTIYTKKSFFEVVTDIKQEDYINKTINELYGGSYQGTVNGASDTLEDKKTALIESFFVPNNIPSYAYGFDENLLPYFWVDENGDVIEEYPMNINITEVYIPIYVTYIGNNAFSNQTALTAVYAGLANRPTISSNAFSNCTSLKDIYIRLKKDTIEKITGYDTIWGAPDTTTIHCVESFDGTLMLEYDTSKYKIFS